MSILQAQPSARDSRSYLKAFASEKAQRGGGSNGKRSLLNSKNPEASANTEGHTLSITGSNLQNQAIIDGPEGEAKRGAPGSALALNASLNSSNTETMAQASKNTELVESLLNPITEHTALVKVQGPFTHRQIASIAEGLVYLDRLGLVSIVVIDDETWASHGFVGASSWQIRKEMVEAANELAEAIENIGGRAIPLTNGVFKLGNASQESTSSSLSTSTSSSSSSSFRQQDHSHDQNHQEDLSDNTSLIQGEEAQMFDSTTCVSSLDSVRAAISRGEMPIITPVARDAALSSVAVPANDAIKALVAALLQQASPSSPHYKRIHRNMREIDLTPFRMMIINREGGIPSPARGGNPHLSINLESEFDYIQDTFIWDKSHPTSLSNLSLLRSCLFQLPRESSAVIVSHRSPKSMIANLITNKPAFSPSLHQSLLPVKHIQHMPTIVRRGLPIRVIRDFNKIDLDKCTRLLEASFKRKLKSESFYNRLKETLDFIIVAGENDSDYQAAAIVTREKDPLDASSPSICYLDKFAVLPSLQGDGTVDFLWTALRDETFGLGLLDALNPNGGKEGFGFGMDLVWRSRADNPVNKWYFERSNGFIHIPSMGPNGPKGTLFWSDAEDRLVRQLEASVDSSQENNGSERKSISIVMREEEGRLARWSRIIGGIKSCWV